MTCHQRKLRDEHMAKEGCALDGEYRLRECVVREISRKEAATIILRYEWLKSMPQVGRAYYGLFRPDGALIGAACFGAGPSQHARDFCGIENRDRVICLERGACKPMRGEGAHADNAASFLISRACKQAAKDHGWGAFFAYSDVEAGELGTVYQAANWSYIGRGTKRGGHRMKYTSPEGEEHTSRRMRSMMKRAGFKGTLREYFPQVLEPLGWTRWQHPEKHKYILILDEALKFNGNPWIGHRLHTETLGKVYVGRLWKYLLISAKGDFYPYPKRNATEGSAGAACADWRVRPAPYYTRFGKPTQPDR